MKTGKKVLSCAVGALLLRSLLLGGCNSLCSISARISGFPLADHDGDRQLDAVGKGRNHKHQLVYRRASYSAAGGSQVMDEILRKTGVKINFRKATTETVRAYGDDRGNDLPDLVSITASIGQRSGFDQRTCRRWALRCGENHGRREMYNTYKGADDELA
ncbi:MAG: hypothetical protein ACLRSW_16410 [Christensenellaceae bacterium]